jgi:hypothetical protein
MLCDETFQYKVWLSNFTVETRWGLRRRGRKGTRLKISRERVFVGIRVSSNAKKAFAMKRKKRFKEVPIDGEIIY